MWGVSAAALPPKCSPEPHFCSQDIHSIIWKESRWRTISCGISRPSFLMRSHTVALLKSQWKTYLFRTVYHLDSLCPIDPFPLLLWLICSPCPQTGLWSPLTLCSLLSPHKHWNIHRSALSFTCSSARLESVSFKYFSTAFKHAFWLYFTLVLTRNAVHNQRKPSWEATRHISKCFIITSLSF